MYRKIEDLDDILTALLPRAVVWYKLLSFETHTTHIYIVENYEDYEDLDSNVGERGDPDHVFDLQDEDFIWINNDSFEVIYNHQMFLLCFTDTGWAWHYRAIVFTLLKLAP